MDIVPPEAASPGPPEAAPPPVGGAPSGLDDLFGLAASQGRDRRAGGRVTEASEPRKPKVVTSRPDVRKPPGGE